SDKPEPASDDAISRALAPRNGFRTASTSAASGTPTRSTGCAPGDFTCTVVGDSYIIRDGRIAEPLRANTIRINDNIATILNNVVGVTKDVRGTVVWGEVAYTPEIAVSGVRVDAIASFMED